MSGSRRRGSGRGTSDQSAGRDHVKVRTARRRKSSSTRWLSRQLNDPYVVQAKKAGYRSRSAFKLIELDDRFGFLEPGARVVDLGAAPGGWTQVAVARVGAGNVIAVDTAPIEGIAGARLINADALEDKAVDAIRQAVDGRVDVVLSDMAPAATGHRATDHLRIVALADAAFAIARRVLRRNGIFIAKVYQGGAEGELLAELKQAFRTVRHAKPRASRPESPETYVIAAGFRSTNQKD